MFNCEPITEFNQNINLKELIGSNKIERNKFIKKKNTETKTKQMLSMPGKYEVALFETSTKNNTFRIQQFKKIYDIPQR